MNNILISRAQYVTRCLRVLHYAYLSFYIQYLYAINNVEERLRDFLDFNKG